MLIRRRPLRRVDVPVTEFTYQIDRFWALDSQGKLLRGDVEEWLDALPKEDILGAIAEFEVAIPDYIQSLPSQGIKVDCVRFEVWGDVDEIIVLGRTVFGLALQGVEVGTQNETLDEIDEAVLGPIYAR